MKNEIKSSNGSTVEIVQLDKSQCEDLYSSIPEFQRSRNLINVSKIKNSIDNGSWEFNGCPIVVDSDKRLIDGQHRIKAFLEKDFYPEVIKVSINSDSFQTFSTIDCGKARSLSDVFKSHNIKDSTVYASITKSAYSIKVHNSYANRVSDSTDFKVLLDFFYKNEATIRDAKTVGTRLRSIAPKSAISTVAFVLLDAGYDVDAFINKLSTLVDMSKPQANYHKVLMNNMKRVRGSMNTRDHMKTFIFFFKSHTEGLSGGLNDYAKFMSKASVDKAIKVALNTKNENKSLEK